MKIQGSLCFTCGCFQLCISFQVCPHVHLLLWKSKVQQERGTVDKKKLHRKQHGVVFNCNIMMKLFLKPTAVSRVSGCLSLPVILKLHAGMMVAAIQTITIHLLTIQTTCNETSSQSLEQYMFKLF